MASLGIDISDNMGQGMGPDMAYVGGRKALLECGLRRFMVDEGSWPADRALGYNVRRLIGENISDVEAIRQRYEAEWEKDERVLECTAVVTWRPTTRELFIRTTLLDSRGPFQFVLRASQATVEILRDGIDTTLGVNE